MTAFENREAQSCENPGIDMRRPNIWYRRPSLSRGGSQKAPGGLPVDATPVLESVNLAGGFLRALIKRAARGKRLDYK